MKGSVLERLGRGDAAEPFNWVTRTKVQSLMDEHYHRCKSAVDQHLGAYYGDHQGSFFLRSGVTATVSVELFESQATKLVGLLAESLKPYSRDAKAFQMIVDMTSGFLSYVDLVVGRIGPRIDLEMRNLPKSENPPSGAGKLWAESRARVLECLDRHRSQFGLPERPAPDAAAPAILELECLQAACEVETEIELAAEAEAEVEFPLCHEEESQPLPLAEHWHEMWADIAVRLCTAELRPAAQGDLAGAMANWFADRGIEGAEEEVEDCARRLWMRLAPPQGVTCSLDQSAIDLVLDMGETTLDRLARQFGSLCSAGFEAGGKAHSCNAAFRREAAAVPPERPHRSFARREPAAEEPLSASMRYHVSWAMREGSPLPAPGFDIG